jgi:uncharacterized protein YdhG (YjbR/CyaY superfamily)
MIKPIAKDVDSYMLAYTDDIQVILKKIRKIILETAPEAEEKIAYGMPSYKAYGRQLVYFAGHAKHIGFYALPSGHTAFSEEMAAYKQGKGSVRFPLDQEIPYELIRKIVAFRLEENRSKTI